MDLRVYSRLRVSPKSAGMSKPEPKVTFSMLTYLGVGVEKGTGRPSVDKQSSPRVGSVPSLRGNEASSSTTREPAACALVLGGHMEVASSFQRIGGCRNRGRSQIELLVD